MYIDETIELRADLLDRLQRDFVELRKYYDEGDGFNFDIFLRELRRWSKDIIWREKSAGRIWTVYSGNMVFCNLGYGEVNNVAITVNIYYSGVNGNAKKFAEEMAAGGIVSDIRAEDGNMGYEYFLPMDDSETVLLIDRWRDQPAIDAHHNSPMMAKIAVLREKYGLHMKVERYVFDHAVPVADKAFIKE